MASFYSTELYVTADPRTLPEEQLLPETLRRMSLLTRVLCFLALGRPDLEDHWKSLQSEQAFETVRSRLCSILDSTITTAGVLLAVSGVFVTTGSPVPYFDYTSPAPHCLFFMSLMLAMIAMLTSGSSMIRWLHSDRHWTREQLKPGGYFVLSYLLSIVIPMFFVAWSLHCFIFAMVIAGFCFQSTICRVVYFVRRQYWNDVDTIHVEVCDSIFIARLGNTTQSVLQQPRTRIRAARRLRRNLNYARYRQ